MTTKSFFKKNLQICNSFSEENPIQSNGTASDKLATVKIRKAWQIRLIFTVLLVSLTVFAYLPSLDKIFTNDQLSYFLELNGETSFSSGFRLLDYGATRQYNKGDEILYRPLLFVLLALENSFLHRDFRLWNVANLLFHLLITYLLFEVLWRIKRSIFACGFALLFALLMSNFALVTWNHLGGYILGYGLLLIAILSAREIGRDNGYADIRWFWSYIITMTAAMLFHEIAVIASFGIVAYVVYSHRGRLRTKWIRLIAATGTPILIYTVLYSFHFLKCNRFFYVDTHGLADSSIKYLARIPLLILSWIQHISSPVLDQFLFSPMHPLYWKPLSGNMIPEIVFAVLLWIGMLFFLRRGFERNHLKESLPFATLIFFLLLLFAGMNIAGRSYHAVKVSYYDYFPALFGLLLLYILIDFSKVRTMNKWAALACIFLLILNNGLHVRNISNKMQKVYRPAAGYFECIEKTVSARLSSPDFSFDVQGMPSKYNVKSRPFYGYPDQGNYIEILTLNFLYGRYYNSLKPSYILIIRDVQPCKVDLLTLK